MTPAPLLAGLLALAAVAMTTAAGWALAIFASRTIRCLRIRSAAVRAVLLAHSRLLPLTLTLLVLPAQIVGFVRLEGAAPESAGPMLIAAAVLGLFLSLDAIWSGVRALRGTRAIVNQWRATASPFCVPAWTREAWLICRRLPVVAVVGIVRPQLFIARQVAANCTAPELAAIAAHEAAHVAARDNLLRLLFRVTPGARFASRIDAELEREWVAAAEEAADADARREADPLDLASALIKVGRLSAHGTPEPTDVSALIGSNDLEARVRRLVDPQPPANQTRFAWIPLAWLVGSFILLQTSPALSVLHELFELLVRK